MAQSSRDATATAVIGDDASRTAAVAESPSEVSKACDRASTYSDESHMGTGAAFLLLGIGTFNVAHRRRWRTIDLRDGADVVGAVGRDRA